MSVGWQLLVHFFFLFPGFVPRGFFPLVFLPWDHPGPEHLVQPLNLLQSGCFGNRLFDVFDLIRGEARRVGSGPTPAAGRKGLPWGESFGALFNFLQLIFAFLALEQSLGGLTLFGLDFLKVENSGGKKSKNTESFLTVPFKEPN